MPVHYNTGMMLGAIARAGAVLQNDTWVARAELAADFIKTHLWKENKLIRAVYNNQGQVVM